MAFAYYKSITLASAQAGVANSLNWPLTIALDGNVQTVDVDLKSIGNGGFVQSTSGYDIRPYADVALRTPLTYELVYYQATTGKLEMHVNIPTLSHTVDTVIYLAFGDSTLTTDGSSTSTWDTNFKGVWHLSDGTTLSSKNSKTGSAGTVTGAAAIAAQIDGGASFTAITDKITTDLTALAVSADRTWSVWFKDDNSGASTGRIFDMGATSIQRSGATALALFYDGDVQAQWQPAKPNDTNWHHVVMTYNNSSASNDPIVYIDGAIVAANNIARFATAGSTAQAVLLGNRAADSRNWGTGGLDELRIADVIRSASWIIADYNSQKASSTFIGWSAKINPPTVIFHYQSE